MTDNLKTLSWYLIAVAAIRFPQLFTSSLRNDAHPYIVITLAHSLYVKDIVATFVSIGVYIRYTTRYPAMGLLRDCELGPKNWHMWS